MLLAKSLSTEPERIVGKLQCVDASLTDWTRSFTLGRLMLIIGAFLFALYPEVILGTHSFFDRDFGLFTYPVAHYAREQLRHGRVPLWNPLNDCGVPFLAQWNTGVCYPLSILYVLFPLPWSLNYFCFGHLLLAGLGMYLLARDWTGNPFAATLAGLAYALNGLAFNCLMWTSNLAALAWLPLVVLFVSRGWKQGGRTLLAGVAAASMQMLAGAPEIVLVTWLVLGSLWLVEVFGKQSFQDSHAHAEFRVRTSATKTALRLASMILLVAGLCAIQLLPFFQLVAHSDRTTSDGNGNWSLPLSGLANFLVPLFHCSKTILGTYIQVNQQWTSSYYVGIGILALAALAAFKVRTTCVCWLTGVVVCSVLLALGDSAFLYPLCKRALPLFGSARYPIKFLVPAIFGLPLLAALVVSAAARWDRRTWLKNISLVGLALLGLTVSILGIARVAPAPDEVWTTTLESGVSRVLMLGLVLAGLFAVNFAATAARRRWAAFGVLAVLGLDATTHTARQNLTVRNTAYGPLQYSMSAAPKAGESRAMMSPQAQAVLGRASLPDAFTYYVGNRKSLFENCNLIDDVPKLNGFYSLHLREHADINGIIYQPTNYPSGLIDFLGASQLTADDDFWKWVSRPSALPLISGGQKVIFSDRVKTLSALARPEFAARETLFLEPEAARVITATNRARVDIQQKTFSADRVELSVSASGAAMVVFAQNAYPAWKAFIDGTPTALFRANHAFQALQVPRGQHEVILLYRDIWFYIGTAVTACSLLVCAALWLRWAKGR